MADWPTLLGTNDRRGGTSARRKDRPADLAWKAALPDSIRSSPVLADGLVFVTCRDGRLRDGSLSLDRQWRPMDAGQQRADFVAIRFARRGALPVFGATARVTERDDCQVISRGGLCCLASR